MWPMIAAFGSLRPVITYFRFDERTGQRMRYAASVNQYIIHKDTKYYTKKGTLRFSIRVGGKRFYLEK